MAKPSLREIALLPIVDKRLSCGTCIGKAACCRAGSILPLSRTEANEMLQDGAQLAELLPGETHGNKPGRRRAFFRLVEDCVHLTPEGTCDNYDERPAICREVMPGKFTCQRAQVELGGAEVETLCDGSTRIKLPTQSSLSPLS